jgi:DNA-binding NarL/FixJ family response regulator
MEESVGHSGGRRSSLDGQLLYLDRQSLTRDCLGRWFDAELDEYDVVVLGDPAALDDKSLDPGAVRAIVFNAGVECMASDLVVDWLARLRKSLPDAPVIVLSNLEDRSEIIDGFGLGIRGYIPTSLTPDIVVEAVRLVCAGGTFAPVSLARAPTG